MIENSIVHAYQNERSRSPEYASVIRVLNMTPYKNLNGNSNVESYEIEADSITVQFTSGTCRYYLYTSQRPGTEIVGKMKVLAQQGYGLNSYITRVVKNNFERKW